MKREENSDCFDDGGVFQRMQVVTLFHREELLQRVALPPLEQLVQG